MERSRMLSEVKLCCLSVETSQAPAVCRMNITHTCAVALSTDAYRSLEMRGKQVRARFDKAATDNGDVVRLFSRAACHRLVQVKVQLVIVITQHQTTTLTTCNK